MTWGKVSEESEVKGDISFCLPFQYENIYNIVVLDDTSVLSHPLCCSMLVAVMEN